MNLRAIYQVHDKPVPLEKVLEGLWVAKEVSEPSDDDLEQQYFRSVKLFREPMIKKSARKMEHSQDQSAQSPSTRE